MKKENIESRDYTFCSATYLKEANDGIHSHRVKFIDFLVSSPYQKKAERLAHEFCRNRLHHIIRNGWELDEIQLYPRNYVKRARVLHERGAYL